VSLYEKMKARGVSMSWHERSKARQAGRSTVVPLDNERCYLGSIYLLKADGSLWRLQAVHRGVAEDGSPITHYVPLKQVRGVRSRPPRCVRVRVLQGPGGRGKEDHT
jgi:hypothetical protein